MRGCSEALVAIGNSLKPRRSGIAERLLMFCGPGIGLLLSLHSVVNYDLGFHIRTGEVD